MNALIIPIARPTASRPPMTLKRLVESLPKIESTIDWLISHQICVLGFGCCRSGPVVTVAAHPSVYMLARGEAERIGIDQRGLLRHETWRFAARGCVDVMWEEVVCVH